MLDCLHLIQRSRVVRRYIALEQVSTVNVNRGILSYLNLVVYDITAAFDGVDHDTLLQ